MADVFISYAREDLARAKLLAEALIAEGLSVWWDHDLLGGDQFRDQITQTIAASACVIVIWSEASVKSPFVKDEASRANDKGRLLPVAIGDVEPPVGFGELQTIRFKRWAETTAEWETLVRTVHARLRAAGLETKPAQTRFAGASREVGFFSRNIDLFLLTMLAQALACFIVFQPLHFLTVLPEPTKLGLVGLTALVVAGFQTWPLISQRSGHLLRAFSFLSGTAIGLAAYYVSGSMIEQATLLLREEAGGVAGGMALVSGMAFLLYMMTWGIISILLER